MIFGDLEFKGSLALSQGNNQHRYEQLGSMAFDTEFDKWSPEHLLLLLLPLCIPMIHFYKITLQLLVQ